MNDIDNFKETVLKEFPRYGLDDTFCFECHPGLRCFTECCSDITIFLTPYDIIRMKNNLGISSQEFLQKYTVSPFTKEQRLPIVVLKMGENAEKRCPFVTERGCTLYEDRPWACRMYPLGLASPKENESPSEEDFYFLLREPSCEGLKEERKLTISEWLEDQGVSFYNQMGEDFKEITLHDYFQKGNNLSPEQMEMFYMVCYNMDKFREFVFDSTFLNRLDVDEDTIQSIRTDDAALLKFGLQWLRFCLFREKTIQVKEDVAQRVRDQAHVKD